MLKGSFGFVGVVESTICRVLGLGFSFGCLRFVCDDGEYHDDDDDDDDDEYLAFRYCFLWHSPVKL